MYRWRGHIRRRKEGFFEAGNYRYSFTARELGEAFAAAGFGEVRVGGLVVVPGMAERLGIGAGAQRRLIHNPLARPFAHYLLATAVA